MSVMIAPGVRFAVEAGATGAAGAAGGDRNGRNRRQCRRGNGRHGRRMWRLNRPWPRDGCGRRRQRAFLHGNRLGVGCLAFEHGRRMRTCLHQQHVHQDRDRRQRADRDSDGIALVPSQRRQQGEAPCPRSAIGTTTHFSSPRVQGVLRSRAALEARPRFYRRPGADSGNRRSCGLLRTGSRPCARPLLGTRPLFACRDRVRGHLS